MLSKNNVRECSNQRRAMKKAMNIICIILFSVSIAYSDSEVFGIKRKPIILNTFDEIAKETILFPSLVSYKNEMYLLSLVQAGVDIAGITCLGIGVWSYTQRDPLNFLGGFIVGPGLLLLNRLGSMLLNPLSNEAAKLIAQSYDSLDNFVEFKKTGISIVTNTNNTTIGLDFTHKRHHLTLTLPVSFPSPQMDRLGEGMLGLDSLGFPNDLQIYYRDKRVVNLIYEFTAIKTRHTEYVMGLRIQNSLRDYWTQEGVDAPLNSLRSNAIYFSFSPLLGMNVLISDRFALHADFEINYPYSDNKYGYSRLISSSNDFSGLLSMTVGVW